MPVDYETVQLNPAFFEEDIKENSDEGLPYFMGLFFKYKGGKWKNLRRTTGGFSPDDADIFFEKFCAEGQHLIDSGAVESTLITCYVFNLNSFDSWKHIKEYSKQIKQPIKKTYINGPKKENTFLTKKGKHYGNAVSNNL